MAAVEGQISALISKRLRTLRKKYNRITDMEESISQGKTLNKEQEDTLRSKPIVSALIDELVKLRIPPPSAAISEETSPPAKNKKQQKLSHARKEVAEEENVTAKTDIEDCKISDDGINSEVSKDDTSPSSESSQGVTPSPLSRKARRKRNAKKPQIPQ
ncbi:hypothetical protein AtNW77_Chr3g0184521 [Arabidopsis thaliana]|uniref:Uncharacterized protein n=4 Tax=Arabidopsis TaxID=3701 RepID=A0A384L441_ARATH|nr:uncharacterized protein AT3G24690 [Arabidopsis thaliana]KAG7626467.1 hypothetical protein ISN45_At03g026200 [Arabidopsis thaliana x Arabidopsis arenosa]KAG7632452.1 hypothetical protein ISN44_As03g025900 [Arabidopsis suecica]AEE76936.1 hypothetical protein AT3G24690 [Arabidopsis thaliana]OAP04493.1 hypothetical protein AXX17_AT3G26730 [Arabidopsis thaliana]CAA0383578.1 unnamed protein product [Arabidopsis thaliana]|eukprot:NP_189112.1 hypothetical protein AT3G24690 [Arabidopsis thaliana]